MRYAVNEPFDHLAGQRLAWNLLRQLFQVDADDGVVYFRHPWLSAAGNALAPDFLVLSRRQGLWLFSCLGQRAAGLSEAVLKGSLDAGDLAARSLYQRLFGESALNVAASARAAVVEAAVDKSMLQHRLLLPFIDAAAWQRSGLAAADPGERVWSFEDLQPQFLRQRLAAAAGPPFAAPQWQRLQALLRGSVPGGDPVGPEASRRRRGSERLAPLRQTLAGRSRYLDESQERVAQEAPEGPQRIRGVAGSGKTMLLVQRAAWLHAAHPDWELAFLFHARHRAEHLRESIRAQFQALTGRSPDFDRLHLWQVWGDDRQPGLLQALARRWDRRLPSRGEILARLGWREARRRGLAWACERLQEGQGEVEPFLDALLIDEGQDLPPAVYQLGLRLLRPPRRLYWTFDELQGLGSLVVPRAADLFGLDASGRPLLDLSGHYPSGMPRTRQLHRSYRVPAAVLGVAQGLAMGLLRRQGPLQAVGHRDEWRNLGFDIAGDLSMAGIRRRQLLEIERERSARVHPLDQLEASGDGEGDRGDGDEAPSDGLLQVLEVDDEQEAMAAIVAGLRADLAAGLGSEDLLLVVMPEVQPTPEKIGVVLRHAGIAAHVVSDQADDLPLRVPGAITVASVEVARGMEAWKVYVCGLHRVTGATVTQADDELLRRNQAFVALTRTRLWCVAIGERGPFMTEAAALHRAGGRYRFPAFDPATLHRDISSWVLGALSDSERMIELN